MIKTINKIGIGCVLLVSALLPLQSVAQVTGVEQTYAERVAMRELDNKCHLFNNFERRALNAFMLQARGEILRNTYDDARVSLITRQAKQGVANRQCNDNMVNSEAARIRKAYNGWKAQMMAEYRGVNNIWHASRAGVDNWRAWQDVGGGNRAGFVRAQNGLAFSFETPNFNYSGARIYLRNPQKIGYPKIYSKGKPPLRVGTDSFLASYVIDAQTKTSVDSKKANGELFVFGDNVTRKIIALDPRDYFEVELFDPRGNTKTYVVEVGDVIAAFVFGAEF